MSEQRIDVAKLDWGISKRFRNKNNLTKEEKKARSEDVRRFNKSTVIPKEEHEKRIPKGDKTARSILRDICKSQNVKREDISGRVSGDTKEKRNEIAHIAWLNGADLEPIADILGTHRQTLSRGIAKRCLERKQNG